MFFHSEFVSMFMTYKKPQLRINQHNKIKKIGFVVASNNTIVRNIMLNSKE